MKKALLLIACSSTLLLTGCSWTKKPGTDVAMMKKEDAMMKDESMKNDETMKDDTMMMGTGMTGEWTKEQMEAMEKEKMMKDEKMMDKDSMMMKKEPASYQNYSSSAVSAALQAGKKVALFFHASRCPGCRSLDKDITAGLSSLPENTVVFKVDYDTAADLKKTYGVTSQHTVVAINKDLSSASKTVGTTLDGVKKQLQ